MPESPTQAAHDLCWAINSPSLVDGPDVAPTPPIDFDSVDHDHLNAFLEEQGSLHRVGRYFEQLIHYWLRHVRKVEVVATGLQLKDDKITVGEIDFLHRDEAGTLVHCEASVKFFLCAPGTEPSEFPGPNARDNFEAKSTKLFDKQLPASTGYIDGIGARLGLVKGMIFYHRDEPDAELPARLPEGHAKGRWLRESELASLNVADHCFVVAQKPHWLAAEVDPDPLSHNDLTSWLGHHFANAAHPVMISARTNTNPEVEQQRLFVVSSRWPELPH